MQRPMEQMRHGVVALDGRSALRIDRDFNLGPGRERSRILVQEMQHGFTRFLRLNNAPELASAGDLAA